MLIKTNLINIKNITYKLISLLSTKQIFFQFYMLLSRLRVRFLSCSIVNSFLDHFFNSNTAEFKINEISDFKSAPTIKWSDKIIFMILLETGNINAFSFATFCKHFTLKFGADAVSYVTLYNS